MKWIRLVFHYLIDFTWSNLVIAKQVLSPRIKTDPVLIEMATKAESPFEVLALSNLISFTPGTLIVEIEPGEKMVVHALNDDPDLPCQIRDRIEKPLTGSNP